MTDDSSVKIPAVILAGGDADDEMISRFGISYRSELPVYGKPMYLHVFEALNASENIGNIRIVGNLICDSATEIIPSADSLLENLIAGVKASAKDISNGSVLVATSDIPFVTPEAINDFIVSCRSYDADLFYPYIQKSYCDQKYPGVKRTFVKLAEGVVTGGNIFLMKPSFVEANANLLRKIMADRKNIAKMSRLVGLSTLFRMIIAQLLYPRALSIGYLENHIGKIINAKLKAVDTPYPEIGTDIDRVDQLDALVHSDS